MIGVGNYVSASPSELGNCMSADTWIEDTLTGPVLAALGHIATPADGQPWPRVWWCPVGILAYLPLHAAGHHLAADHEADRAHPRAVLDRVVSSYTATVRGLAYARGQHPDPAANETLIIAVPDAPGPPPLDGVTAEADALADLIPGAHLLARPTRDTVLEALPGHPVAHFACARIRDDLIHLGLVDNGRTVRIAEGACTWPPGTSPLRRSAPIPYRESYDKLVLCPGARAGAGPGAAPPAAMRYTECRLAPLAMEMLRTMAWRPVWVTTTRWLSATRSRSLTRRSP